MVEYFGLLQWCPPTRVDTISGNCNLICVCIFNGLLCNIPSYMNFVGTASLMILWKFPGIFYGKSFQCLSNCTDAPACLVRSVID